MLPASSSTAGWRQPPPHGFFTERFNQGDRAPKSARWMGRWMWVFCFFSPRTSNGETRASEPGCSCVMDGCLSSPPPGCPPPSGRDWSGALHHICLRGNILQQLMGDRATAAAAAAAASGSYMMSASVWVYTGTIFSPTFSFCYKRRHFDYFCMPHSSFGPDAVFCPRVALKRVRKPVKAITTPHSMRQCALFI